MKDLSLNNIENMIYVIRGQRVMLDSDLAALYGVETFNFNKSVKRNINRFPNDFMFQLTEEEFRQLEIENSKRKVHGGRRSAPYAFTENGVAMLSSVLNSEKAIFISISIMRIFTKLRSFLLLEKDLNERMNKIEIGTNRMFKIVFEMLDDLEEQLPNHLSD